MVLLAEILNENAQNVFPWEYVLLPHELPIPVINTYGEPSEGGVVDLTGIDSSTQSVRIPNELFHQGATRETWQKWVTNHGIAEGVMAGAMIAANNFFGLPNNLLRPKAVQYQAYSSTYVHYKEYHTSAKYWRDTVGFYLHEQVDEINAFDGHVAYFASRVKPLAEKLLSLISERLGLGKTYFEDNGLSTVRRLNVNSYPRCSCPTLTCGLPKHCDPDLLTITLEGGAHGLQFLDENNQWQTLKARKNALFVTIGTQMQVVSNDILKAPPHRVLVNSERARTSICYALAPRNSTKVEPAAIGLPGASPKHYERYTYEDYLKEHMLNYRDTSSCLSRYRLNHWV